MAVGSRKITMESEPQNMQHLPELDTMFSLVMQYSGIQQAAIFLFNQFTIIFKQQPFVGVVILCTGAFGVIPFMCFCGFVAITTFCIFTGALIVEAIVCFVGFCFLLPVLFFTTTAALIFSLGLIALYSLHKWYQPEEDIHPNMPGTDQLMDQIRRCGIPLCTENCAKHKVSPEVMAHLHYAREGSSPMCAAHLHKGQSDEDELEAMASGAQVEDMATMGHVGRRH